MSPRTVATIALYKVLYFFHLGRAFNKLVCLMGMYHQYQPGVCGWCGVKHVKPNHPILKL